MRLGEHATGNQVFHDDGVVQTPAEEPIPGLIQDHL